MRGLRLFVRPIEATDDAPLAAFYAANLEDRIRSNGQSATPAWGLLGKLLGEIVVVVALEITEDALRVDEILVDRNLRRKRVGKAILREVEDLALRLDRRRIIVENAHGVQEFFRRVGFESEGERWIRVVSQPLSSQRS